MNYFRIKVLNFDEHNQKARGKSLPWLRLQSRMARSSKYLRLSPGAKLMWIWLLCESAQSSSREAHVCPRDVSKEIHVKPQNVPKVISELTDLEWIQVLSAPKASYDMRRDERTNERTEREGDPASPDPSPPEPTQVELIPPDPPPPPPPDPEPELHWLAAMWNDTVKRLPKVKTATGKRLEKIKSRLKERPDPEAWRRILEKVDASDFLTGKNDRGWTADFDWLLGNNKHGVANHVRVDEGSHDNRGGQAGRSGKDISPEYKRPMDRDFEDRFTFGGAYEDQGGSDDS